jgi:O-acetylhomoserine (thiol)-lyase
MNILNSKNEETLVLHSGWRSDPSTNSVAVPIYQTTSYQFNDASHAENLFALKELGNIYTRIMNPTCDVLEKRLAAFEGGVAALAVSSGQSATAIAIQNLAKKGDNIISSTDIYGGTWNLFSNTLNDQGIEVRFVDPSRPESFKEASDTKTRAYFGETLPNPKLNVFPIEEVAEIGKSLGIPLILDNTAAPFICKPFNFGASIIVHSTTKYIGGQGSAIGGVIIDGGNFKWQNYKNQQPALNKPDPSYHGTIWTNAAKPLGPIAYILKARTTVLRDIGSAMSPFNAFQFIQGIETLPLRIERQSQNAQKVVNFLNENDKISKVIYPNIGKPEKKNKYFNKKLYGNLIGFHIKNGYEACKKFINNLNLFYHVANIGDVRSLAIHPSSTTHSQLSLKDQHKAGVSKDYIRLSIGIEHIDDILEDLTKSLDNI